MTGKIRKPKPLIIKRDSWSTICGYLIKTECNGFIIELYTAADGFKCGITDIFTHEHARAVGEWLIKASEYIKQYETPKDKTSWKFVIKKVKSKQV